MTRRCKMIAALLLALSIVLPAAAEMPTTQVPLRHWVYDLLDRWETAGHIEYVFDHTRPYTRREVAAYLDPVFALADSAPERLTGHDRDWLRYCATEFEAELRDAGVLDGPPPATNRFLAVREYGPFRILPDFLYANNRNLAAIERPDFAIYGDLVAQASRYREVGQGDSVLTTTHLSNGLRFRGGLGERLGFAFMLMDNHIERDPGFPPLEVFSESGWPYRTIRSDVSLDYNENAAYLTYADRYVTLMFGRDYNQWGAGKRGQMMLSTNAPLYDQFKVTVRYGRFKYTHLTAFLQYIEPEARRSIKASENLDVFWSGNRLEVYLGRGVQLGLSESVVYGNQSLDPGYLNPLAFYKSIEHFNGDRDNGALGADLAWRVRPGLKVYGELYVDDLTTGKLGSDWYGNKFGHQAGLFWVDPFRLAGVDLLAEYARIKPYVYSHTVQDYNKYKHYDTMLGHAIGPNSDDWFLRLRYAPTRRLRLQVDWERYRHGGNVRNEAGEVIRNVGGDADLPFRNGDNPDAVFLDGERVERGACGGSVQYELFRHTFLTAQLHRVTRGGGGSETSFFLRMSHSFGQRDESVRPFRPAVR